MCTRCMYWSTCVKTCKCYRLLPKQVPNSMMISTRNYLLSRDQSSGCYKYFSGGVLSNCVHFHPSGLWSKINTNNLQAHSPLMMDEHPPQNSENHSVVEMTVPFFNASICTLVHERENRIPIFRCSMNTYRVACMNEIRQWPYFLEDQPQIYTFACLLHEIPHLPYHFKGNEPHLTKPYFQIAPHPEQYVQKNPTPWQWNFQPLNFFTPKLPPRHTHQIEVILTSIQGSESRGLMRWGRAKTTSEW